MTRQICTGILGSRVKGQRSQRSLYCKNIYIFFVMPPPNRVPGGIKLARKIRNEKRNISSYQEGSKVKVKGISQKIAFFFM